MIGYYTESEYAKAYKEIIELLRYIPIEETRKIPQNIIDYYDNNKDGTYEFQYNPNIDFNKQKIMHLTKILIANLYKNYWCDELERIRIEKREEREIQSEQYEEYNTDNLFKKKKEETKNEIAVIKKENILYRIIKRIFKKQS